MLSNVTAGTPCYRDNSLWRAKCADEVIVSKWFSLSRSKCFNHTTCFSREKAQVRYLCVVTLKKRCWCCGAASSGPWGAGMLNTMATGLRTPSKTNIEWLCYWKDCNSQKSAKSPTYNYNSGNPLLNMKLCGNYDLTCDLNLTALKRVPTPVYPYACTTIAAIALANGD